MNPCAALALSAIAILVTTGGCAADRPRGERAPDLRRGDAESSNIVAVRKIAFESGQTLGYLKVHEEDGGPKVKGKVRVSWVHDTYFNVLGFYTDTGETYRAQKDGGFAFLGIHDMDAAKRILLRAPEDVKLQLLAMDSPRTLESDAEAVAQAKAAADAAKAKSGEAGAPAEGGGAKPTE